MPVDSNGRDDGRLSKSPPDWLVEEIVSASEAIGNDQPAGLRERPVRDAGPGSGRRRGKVAG
jgi:hypothetical protein